MSDVSYPLARSVRASKSKSPTALICPACGAPLSGVTGSDMVVCAYCGAQVMLDHAAGGVARRGEGLQHHRELCAMALKAKNWSDALKHSQALLAANPQDAEAWLARAQATFYQRSKSHDYYAEALEYLKRVAQLQSSSRWPYDLREQFTRQQGAWFNEQGVAEYGHALKQWGSRAQADAAARVSRESFIKAMSLYLAAHRYVPSDLTILHNIFNCSIANPTIQWEAQVQGALQLRIRLLAKQQAEINLAAAQVNLSHLEQEQARLRSQSGLIAKWQLNNMQGKIRDTQAAIGNYEKQVAVDVPAMQYGW